MRTRTAPNWRVRQRASPAVPAWVVTSTVLQSTVPKGRFSMTIGSVFAREHVGEQRRIHVAAGERESHALPGERLALAPRGGEGGGTGAFGHVVGECEQRAHRGGDLAVGDLDDPLDIVEHDGERF